MAKLKIKNKNKKRGKPQQIQAYVVITKEGRQAPEQRKFQNNGGCKQKQIQLKTNKKKTLEKTLNLRDINRRKTGMLSIAIKCLLSFCNHCELW